MIKHALFKMYAANISVAPQMAEAPMFNSIEDVAKTVLGDVNALFAFFVDNNPANVNDTLKYVLKIDSLPFAPDLKSIRSQVDIMVQKDDTRSLQEIINRFRFNPNANNYTTHPALIAAIKKLL